MWQSINPGSTVIFERDRLHWHFAELQETWPHLFDFVAAYHNDLIGEHGPLIWIDEFPALMTVTWAIAVVHASRKPIRRRFFKSGSGAEVAAPHSTTGIGANRLDRFGNGTDPASTLDLITKNASFYTTRFCALCPRRISELGHQRFCRRIHVRGDSTPFISRRWDI